MKKRQNNGYNEVMTILPFPSAFSLLWAYREWDYL